ncbi:hypothetical protein [Priestia aryabhattai]
MRVAVKKFFEAEQSRGKHYFEVKSDLHKAKQEGFLFFANDVSSLTDEEDIDIYYSEIPGMDKNKNAFPIPTEDFFYSSCEKERYSFCKEYYESYYGEEMDYNLFMTFDSKPFKAKQRVWFYRQEA